MKNLLQIWSRELLGDEDFIEIEKILEDARLFCPVEFQRRPGKFQKPKANKNSTVHWKGTQYRDFLLYTALGTIRRLLDEKYVNNFIYFVVGIRGMTRHVPENDDRGTVMTMTAHNAGNVYDIL